MTGNRRNSSSSEETVIAYEELLKRLYPESVKGFQARRSSAPDAALAEAITFSWLRAAHLNPRISDAPGTGGPDLLCSSEIAGEFSVEVTALDGDALADRTGIPNQAESGGGWFSDDTLKLQSVVKRKASQLSVSSLPRVLAICASHPASSALLGRVGAEELMTSPPRYTVPVDDEPAGVQADTDLEQSAFLRLTEAGLVAVRRSVSAILLIVIWDDGLNVMGLLHPDPARPWEPAALPAVPFLRLEWPVRGQRLKLEWLIADPSPAKQLHWAPRLTDEELRRGCS
ncbi:MAG TPA: hypothetical protein VI504_10830 [Candidatus Eisenbacteria bacterium]|jgi:hypothetical protein